MDIEWWVVLVSIIPGIIVFMLLPKQIKYMHKINWIGHDIHKLSRPAVAESGGISVFIGLVAGLVLLLIFVPAMVWTTLAVLGSVACAAAIGFLDDNYRFSALKKIISVVFAAIPMEILYLFTSIIPGTPYIPILGGLHVTILYMFFIPAFLAVLMNATNMYEGYNGQGSSTSIIVTACLILGAICMGAIANAALLLSIPLLASLVGFFYYNKYPARVFPGDIGTLSIGMMFGCIAIVGHMEFVLIIAILPHAFNAFHVIRSVRGFKESDTIKVKDIEVIEGDLIKASTLRNAPLTIPRILVAPKPLSEPALVKNIIALSLTPASLAILSAAWISMLVPGSTGGFEIIIVLIIVATAVFVLSSLKFPATRAMNLLFFTGYFGLIALLLFVKEYIFPIGGIISWLEGGGIGLAGLAVLYFMSFKYFTRLTTRPPKDKSGA
jgi:UDP-N-acetylmuramyl pentapeptide phosphotransferase/UDP-N-acetylglucosamine-1-phosphate transferase